MGGDDDPVAVPPSLVALAICSRESGPGCYLEAPGWHLSRVGDLGMGTSARDAGGEGRGCLARVTNVSPSRHLPGLAWTCWDLPGSEVTLSVRSHCPEIGSWIAIFTRGAESERGVPTGVAKGAECGPPSPGLGTPQLPTGTLGW